MKELTYQDIPMKLAPLLNTLSHPARVQILLHLAKYKGCQAGSISDKLPLAKSTVSEHLSKLKEAGLITCLADGNCMYYSLNEQQFELMGKSFSEFQEAIGQLKTKQKECCPANITEPIKCNRVYEICKTLPCFTEACYPDILQTIEN